MEFRVWNIKISPKIQTKYHRKKPDCCYVIKETKLQRRLLSLSDMRVTPHSTWIPYYIKVIRSRRTKDSGWICLLAISHIDELVLILTTRLIGIDYLTIDLPGLRSRWPKQSPVVAGVKLPPRDFIGKLFGCRPCNNFTAFSSQLFSSSFLKSGGKWTLLYGAGFLLEPAL